MKNNQKVFTEEGTFKPQIRELTLINGLSFPSDQELIMLILGSGGKSCPIEQVAQQAIRIMDASNQDTLIDNLCKVKGIGKNKALALAAAWELGRRRTSFQRAIVTTPKDLLPYVQHFAMYPTEHFVTAILNGAQEILDIKLISVGGTNKAFIHPREVFAEAISRHASAIICCHNHPGGSPRPSQADIDSTKALKKAADALGITFLDHLIITRNEYFSFMEHDLLSL